MRRLSLFLVVFVFSTNSVFAESKSGPAKFTGSETINVTLGGKLKVDATFKQIDVGGIIAISVQAKINSTANTKLNYAYHVAFLDKDKNLIACQHYALFIDPGKQMNAGTFVAIPPDQIARIAFYSVAFYENEKMIGAR